MKFINFMNLIYKTHLEASKNGDTKMKKKLLLVIDNVAIIESNYNKIQELTEVFHEKNKLKEQDLILNTPILLEYKKYKVWKPKLLSLRSSIIKSTFDFKMKYVNFEIESNKLIETAKDKEEEKELIKKVIVKSEKIVKDLLFQMIRHNIHTKNEIINIEKIKNNKFIFKDFYPFFEKDKNLFNINKKIDKKMQDFLLNPIQLDIVRINELLGFYDFENNSVHYERQFFNKISKDGYEEINEILDKIIDITIKK